MNRRQQFFVKQPRVWCPIFLLAILPRSLEHQSGLRPSGDAARFLKRTHKTIPHSTVSLLQTPQLPRGHVLAPLLDTAPYPLRAPMIPRYRHWPVLLPQLRC